MVDDVDPTPEPAPDDDAQGPEAIGFPVTSSVDKMRAVAAELGDVVPEDPMQAAMLTMLAAFAPTITSYLPDDPAELDELLLTGSRWMLSMRSDDAWQPADLDELFLGPDPEPAA